MQDVERRGCKIRDGGCAREVEGLVALAFSLSESGSRREAERPFEGADRSRADGRRPESA